MNNFWVVFSHTFITKLKSKQFIFTTLITLAIILLLGNLSKIIEMFQENEDVQFAVVDETGTLYEGFTAIAESMEPDWKFIRGDSDRGELDEKVLSGELAGYIILQWDDEGLPRGVYRAESLTDMSIISTMETALNQLKTSIAASKMNLSGDQLELLNRPAKLEQSAIGDGVKTQEELSLARGLVYVLLIIIYMSVILYANMIAMEVATEKSSRVMEILISSVPPVVQMFAKIIAIGLVGLLQLLVWLAAGYSTIKQNLDSMSGDFFTVFGFENISMETLIYAIVFFILGFFLYATIAAFLGSLVSRTEEMGQAITPLVWLILIAFLLSIFGLGTPDAKWVTVTSYIPFFTPMIMFMRVSLLDLPLWESMLGILLLVASIVFFGYIGAKIYRGGVLMYGSNHPLKNLRQALRLTKKEM